MNQSRQRSGARERFLGQSLITWGLSVVLGLGWGLTASAQTVSGSESRNGLQVPLPNGYGVVAVDDLSLSSRAGAVKWMRRWDGQEWKFNPHWESLSNSWRNPTGTETADSGGTVATDANGGTPSTPTSYSSGGSSSDGCWVLVDEDWQPSTGTVLIGGVNYREPVAIVRMAPFNRTLSDEVTAAQAEYTPVMRVNIDYANLCAGMGYPSSVPEMEAVRRINEFYLGSGGRLAFNNRSIVEKRSVQALPPTASSAEATPLASGRIALNPVVIANGYRWSDRTGDWIDYNTAGQLVAYGDRNNNTVWLQRDTQGVVRGVVDGTGQVLYTLHYTGSLITEVRDYPVASNGLDLPARSVRYEYDEFNLLTKVTDVRGHVTQYGYDPQHHLTSITDAEDRVETISYNGDVVKQRIAPDGGVTDYEFDYDDVNKQFISKITGPETAAGRRVEDDTHNRVGKLLRRTYNGQLDAQALYDTGARATTITNGRGFSTKTTRNEFDQVIEVAKPDGTAVKYGYSAANLSMSWRVDEAGFRTEFIRDDKGNLLQTTEAVGTPDARVTVYERNAQGQPIQITRKGRTEADGTVTADAVWKIDYDEQGQVKTITDPEEHIRGYTFDRAGNLASYTDPKSRTTRYESDAAGNLLKVTDAVGIVVEMSYDKVGNQLTQKNALGKVARTAYDAMNRAWQFTNEVGGRFEYQYNHQGLPTQEKDEDGRASQLEFDNLLRLTKETDPLGNVTRHSYQIPDGSQAGMLGTLLYPTQTQYPTYTQQTRYDAVERPTSETLLNPNALGTEGLVSAAVYDERGLVKSETDANGKTRFSAYNAFRQLLESTDSLGAKTTALYDSRGNLISLKDARGHTTRFVYDRANHLKQQVLPMGQTTLYQYDEAGDLAERTDPRGYKSIFTRDDRGRIKEIKRYDPQGVLQRTTGFTWDDEDNLKAWTDTDHTRSQTSSGTLGYDDANRKTSETVTYPAGNTLSYGYDYSPAGNKTRMTWADGSAIDYGYSAHGELETVTIPGEGSISVNQFKWVAPTQITLPGGTVQERTYDGLLDLESLKVKTATQQTTLNLQNTYGKVQELKQAARTDTAGGVSTSKTGSYTYDDEIRLTESKVDAGVFNTATETFTLDAVGNRVAHSQVSGEWTYDANNRLTQRGTGSNATTYDYDDAGNLIRKTEPGSKITRYTYDGQNQLVEVSDGANQPIARYGYDPLGRRIWKEQYRNGAGAALNPARRTHYLYADEGIAAEATQDIALNADGSVSALSQPSIGTQYGLTPDSLFGADVLFIKTRASDGQDLVAYYHQDQLGTPIQATDKAGHVVWAASYNVFGQADITTPQATEGSPIIDSNLRLPGQYWDEETGLHYNYYRYYDPQTGRYLQEDPIGLQGGINRYVYADADPANVSDPWGLMGGGGNHHNNSQPFSAADLPTLPDWAVNGAAGFGDGMLTVVTLGIWDGDWVRGKLDIASVDSCSNEYAIGKIAGEISATLILTRARGRCSCCRNSFAEETLVHVRPLGAAPEEALAAKTALRPISQLTVGDEVLSIAEWKDKGNTPGQDQRLSYEKVTDVFTSYKEQTLVHLTLVNGEQLTTTERHPFKTTEGWRDAMLLMKGERLLVKGGWVDSVADENEGVASSVYSNERSIGIADVRVEVKTAPVYNLEVANGHTFFVGSEGALAHNSRTKEAPPPRAGPPGGRKTGQQHRGRTIWDLPKKRYCYWDGYEEEWEVFKKDGTHDGTLNPDGSPRNGPIPGRKGPKR